MQRPAIQREVIDAPASGLLTVEQAARWIGCSVRCLEEWRRKGEGPRSVRLGERMVRYAVDDLRAWVLKLRTDPQMPCHLIERYGGQAAA